MKLNGKFSFIILFTVFQAVILTVFSIVNITQIQNLKNYQITEIKTESQLASIVDYLEKMDFWDFDLENAYSSFNTKKVAITESFNYLLEDPVTETFPEDFKTSLKQTKLTWQLLNDSFVPVENILKTMEATKPSSSVLTSINSFGIRETANLYSQDADIINLLSLTDDAHTQIKKIRLLYVSLMDLNTKTLDRIENIVYERENKFVVITILFAVVTSIILAILIFLVTSRISKRIVKVKNITSTLAEKDFTANVKPEGNDEMLLLMTNINNMVTQINNFFLLVKSTAKKALDSEALINESANTTATATSQIDTNIDKMNKQFTEMVEVINGAIGVIAEMNLHVDTLVKSNNAQTEAIENSNTAVNEVVKTLEYMNKMAVERMENAQEMHTYVADGDEKITSTNEILGHVAEQLDEVYEVVTIINNVAEQTNLLSMNAAIESAHAGDAGKGFSVVAEEIRSLAEETSENADKISRVVNAIVQAVENANKSSQSAFEAFEKVSTHADQIVSSLQEITGGIGKIDSQMLQIKNRSEETASAADYMNKYCTDLADKQRQVSSQVDNMNEVFLSAILSLKNIKEETADIVNKMKDVSTSSDESYKNLTELENVLDEFKTSEVGKSTLIAVKPAVKQISKIEPVAEEKKAEPVAEIKTEPVVEIKAEPVVEKKPAEPKKEETPASSNKNNNTSWGMFDKQVSKDDIFDTTGESTINDGIQEIGEIGIVGQEDPDAMKGRFVSPSLEEIDAKLNQLAMAGGFGISDDMFKSDFPTL